MSWPLYVFVSVCMSRWLCHSKCLSLCLCVCVFVLGAVVLLLQDVEMFTDLLPKACVSTGPFPVSV